MAAGGTSGGTRCPPAPVTPGSWHPPPSPLQSLLERATAIEGELAQGQEKPFTEVTRCHSGDAVAAGRQPPAFLRQVAAVCAHPELLGDGSIPADAKNRAGRVLRRLQGGSPGAYNLEYVTDAVAEKVARYLERRDGGIPGDPRRVVPCGGTAAAMVDVLSLLVDAGSAVATGVLVPVPGPPLLGGATGLAGAVAVPYSLDEEQGWAVDGRAVREALRRARDTCHPKVLCVVNPGDPTGHVLSRQNMEDVVRLAAEENLLLLADEVQQERAFLPGRPFLSFKRVLWEMGAPLSSAVQLVSFYSLSKGAGGGGFRAGFFELVNIDPSVLKCFYTWGLSVYPSILGQVMLESAMEPPLPSDPSFPAFEEVGHVLSRQNMEDVVRLAAEENLLLLADEVQQERAFLPGRPFLSFKRVLWEMGAPLSSAVQLVSFYSLSKGAGGGGFRAGFFELVNIDPSVLKCFYTWGLSVYPSILGQVMLESAMEPPLPSDPSFPAFEEHRQGLLRDLAHNARLVQEVLGRAPGIRCRPVQGGARAFPRIQLPPRAQRQARMLGLEPDVFFCQKLLEATGIVLAPGSEFGQPEGTHHVGLSLLLPAATLERVLLTLTRFHATFLRDFS